MVEAIVVGNSILKKAFAENICITPMKLQKLIYFIYADYYHTTKQMLFEERFETWKYGPVLRSVYNEFKGFGARAISKFGISRDGNCYVINEIFSPDFKQSLDKIWDKYKHYDGVYLSSLTHAEGTAWWKAALEKKPFLDDQEILKDGSKYGGK